MTLIVMYFNNSLTIWNTKMTAIDKEKKSLQHIDGCLLYTSDAADE